ncbi:MAG: hypothetical protein WC862_03910 [Patescibacteria group bacterium]
MPRNTEQPLSPEDIGVITPEIERKYASAAELLARQNALVDGWLEADAAVDQLKAEDKTDPEIIDALNDRLCSLNQQLRSTYLDVKAEAVSSEEKTALERARKDLGKLAVLDAKRKNPGGFGVDPASQPLFFSEFDRDSAMAARTDKETSSWWPRKLRLKMDVKELVGKKGPHADFRDKVDTQRELREHHAARAKYREAVKEMISRTLSDKKLVELEERLEEVRMITRLIGIGEDTLSRTDATELQGIKAEYCLSLARDYLLTESSGEQTFESITRAYAELLNILDIRRLTVKAIKRMKKMLTGLKEQIATARAKGRGIIESAPADALVESDQAQQVHRRVKAAGEEVERVYQRVNDTVSGVLAKLQDGLADPARAEAIVLTIENGNLDEFYLSSFNVAIKEFNQAIGELSKLLNFRPAAALPAKPEPKGLIEGSAETSEAEPERVYREMAELWGEKFLDCKAVEQAFTLQDKRKLVEFSSSQKAEAALLLAEFVKEPDVKQFMEKVKRGEVKKGGWHLRLEVATLNDPKSDLESPLTMAAMEKHVASDMKARNQGKLIYEVTWYKAEQFYTADTMRFSWVLSTDEVLPATLGKNHEAQTKELEKFAGKVGLDFDPARSRSKPIETLYRSFILLRTTDKRILEHTYDWSADTSSDGNFVGVGYCDARGADADGWFPAFASGYLGSSFSRRSGQSRRSLDT